MSARDRQGLGSVLAVAGYVVGGAWGFALQFIGAGLTLTGQRKAAEEARARARAARGQTSTVFGGAQDAVAVYGETVVGGVVADWRSVTVEPPDKDGLNGHYDAHLVIAHALREGGIEGFTGFWLNDDFLPFPSAWDDGDPDTDNPLDGGVPKILYTWNNDGFTFTGTMYEPRDWTFRFNYDIEGDGAVIMRFSDGTRGTPPGELTALSGWDAADKGAGIAYSYWLFKKDDESNKLFSGGRPRIRAQIKGNKVYDPRKDWTLLTAAERAGKTASDYPHRLADRATWEWSDNPALCLADYLYEYSPLRLRDSAGVRQAARVDWPSVADAADVCDAQVPIPPDAEGNARTEPRFRCDCALPVGRGQTHRRNIEVLLASFRGKLLRIGDKWHVVAPKARASGATFDVGRVVGEYQLATAKPLGGRFNAASGRFLDRDRHWATVDALPRRDAAAVARDGEIVLEIEAAAVTRQTQMQRLCAMAIQRLPLQETWTGLLDWSGLNLQPDAAFTLDLPILGGAKKFRVDSMTLFHPNAPVSVTATEDSDAAYADLAAADYHAVTPEGEVTLADAAPFAPGAFAAKGVPDGIEWTWNPPPFYDEVVLYTSATSAWADAEKTYGGHASAFVQPLDPGETRFGWVRAVAGGRQSRRSPNDDVSSVSATALGAGPIVEAVPAGECPPANRGAAGQQWLAIDATGIRRWRHGGDPWTVDVPADAGAGGVDGVLLASAAPRNTPTSVRVGYTANADLPTAATVSPAQVYRLLATPRARNMTLDLRTRAARRANVDFVDDVEGDVVVALRAAKGGRVATMWVDIGADTSDPYSRPAIPDADAHIVDSAGTIATIAAFMALSTGWTFRLLVMRKSMRCAGDPLNPWVPEPDLDLAAGDVTQIFKESENKPAKPVDSEARTPAGWHATVAAAEAVAGDHPVWVVYQHRAPAATLWTRQEPVRIQGRDGEPGQPGLPGAGARFPYDDRTSRESSIVSGSEGRYYLGTSTRAATTWAAAKTATRLAVSSEDADGADHEGYYDRIERGDLVTWFVDDDQWLDYRITSVSDVNDHEARFGIRYVEGRDGDGTMPSASADTELLFSRAPAGVEFVEIVAFREGTRGSNAPAKPTAARYDFARRSLSNASGWSLSPPAIAEDEIVWAIIATASNDGGDEDTLSASDWSTPRPWSAGTELDSIFKQAATQPSTPANSSTKVPTGWSASAEAARSSTSADPIWEVAQHRTGDDADWMRGDPRRLGSDGISVSNDGPAIWNYDDVDKTWDPRGSTQTVTVAFLRDGIELRNVSVAFTRPDELGRPISVAATESDASDPDLTHTTGNATNRGWCDITYKDIKARAVALLQGPQIAITPQPPVHMLINTTGAFDETVSITWRRGSSTASADYRTVRFRVEQDGFSDAPQCRPSRGGGSLGQLPTVGSPTTTNGGTRHEWDVTVADVTAAIVLQEVNIGGS